MSITQYAVPTSIEEAAQLLVEGNATMFAGGTDLMPQTQSGVKQFKPLLMNINRIRVLHGITKTNGTITIGALTTVAMILRDPILKENARVLVDTADCFASGQIRNSATLGGNICNASPAGDMIIPLILLGAEVELTSWKNGAPSSRRLPIHEFFLGPGKTRIEADEILTFIHFNIPSEHFIARFQKFGTRPALDISIVSVGIAGTKENGVMSNMRVAFGAVAPIPLRSREIETAIEVRRAELTPSRIKEIASMTETEIAPIDDVRASAWYRKEITRTFIERVLHDINAA